MFEEKKLQNSKSQVSIINNYHTQRQQPPQSLNHSHLVQEARPKSNTSKPAPMVQQPAKLNNYLTIDVSGQQQVGASAAATMLALTSINPGA